MANWSTQRKVAASVLVVLSLVALTAIAMYQAGELFLMLNRIDPAQARITSIIDYWKLNARDPQQRELLGVAIGMSAGGVLVALLVALVAEFVPWQRLRVAARFASAADIKRAELFYREGDPGLIVGKANGNYLTVRGGQSVMLFAPSRSGKGVGMVIPNLLAFPDSVVVLDTDGRYFDVTAGFRAGFEPVFAFSPFDEQERSHCWNPLSAVRDDKEHREADLRVMAEQLFPDLGQESSDSYFNQQARILFLVVGRILFASPALPRTIGEMRRQASCMAPHVIRLARQRRDQGNPLSAEEAHAVARDFSHPHSEWNHTVATFKAALSIFGEESVDAATSGDDFRLEDVRRRRMSIYVRIPACRLGSAKPLLNLFFSQLVSLNTRQPPAQDKTLRCQCLVVNDQLGDVGRVDAIASKAAVLGDYNLRLLSVVESMSWLKAEYGWEAAHKFAASHAVRIFYAPSMQSHAEEYSAMLGQHSMQAGSWGRIQPTFSSFSGFFFGHERDQRRPLLLPEEFKELGSEQLVLTTPNCKPVLAQKIRYHSDESLQQRQWPRPVVPRLDMRAHMLRIQRRVRDEDVPVSTKSPVVESPGSPLARDLTGLAGRLDESDEKSGDIAVDRRGEHDGAELAPGAAGGGAGPGGVIEAVVEQTCAVDFNT